METTKTNVVADQKPEPTDTPISVDTTHTTDILDQSNAKQVEAPVQEKSQTIVKDVEPLIVDEEEQKKIQHEEIKQVQDPANKNSSPPVQEEGKNETVELIVKDGPSTSVNPQSQHHKVAGSYNDFKYQTRSYLKSSRYQELFEYISGFMKEEYSRETDLEAKAAIFCRYVKCLNRCQKYKEASHAHSVDLPNLKEEVKGNPQALARAIHAQSNLDTLIVYHGLGRSQQEIRDLQMKHDADFVIAKIKVKVMMDTPKDGSQIEFKTCYHYLLEAEEINTEILNGIYKYNKLNLKILLCKVKHFGVLYKQEVYQSLLSQALRDAGTKSYESPNVLTLMADFNSKKGEHEKALTYITRAQKLAQEVLDGQEVHKKYIKIQDTKVEILIRNKQYQEALNVCDEQQKLLEKLYPTQVNWYYNDLLNKRILIFSEKKGEEYKAEDILKEQMKIMDQFCSQILNPKDSLLYTIQKLSTAACYIKLLMPHKVQKIHKEVVEQLTERGLEKSQLRLFADFINIQAIQDPTQSKAIIDHVIELSNEIDKQNGFVGSVSIICEQLQASLKFAEGDMDGAQKILENCIKNCMTYYEGNPNNELVVDPYLYLSGIYMQKNDIQNSITIILKAESVVKALNGELNEKLLEIYQQLSTLMVYSQQIEKALQYIIVKSELAGKIYGQQSEQYCQHLEDQAGFFTEMKLLPQALPLWEKLIRIQKEINGGENNQKVLQLYEALSQVHLMSQKFTDALLITQKVITVYKALNGQEVDDKALGQYLAQCAFIQRKLEKYDDAIRQLDEAQRIFKKIQHTDPEVKRLYETYAKERAEFVKEKNAHEKQFTKPISQRVIPDTPIKMAIWATVLAGIAGAATYVYLKRRQ
eukprot:403377348